MLRSFERATRIHDGGGLRGVLLINACSYMIVKTGIGVRLSFSLEAKSGWSLRVDPSGDMLRLVAWLWE